MSRDEHESVCAAFEVDWSTVLRIPLNEEVLSHVPHLCSRHPLRGADALQLASAAMLVAREIEVTFASSDRRLLEAARSEGIATFDPVGST